MRTSNPAVNNVGIIQSNYIPWRGYFDFIDCVDIFVIHDDIQYTKQDWRNRNRILGAGGTPIWLSVPVCYEETHQSIDSIKISKNQDWRNKHLAQFYNNYRHAPYFDGIYSLYREVMLSRDWIFLADLNCALISAIAHGLNITTKIVQARDLDCQGIKTEKIINIVKSLGGASYVSGPAAQSYLDLDEMKKSNIEVFWKTYSYQAYAQGVGGFESAVSIIDAIAYCGFDKAKIFAGGGVEKAKW